MQRLGFVKYMLSKCAANDTTSLDVLVRHLEDFISIKIGIPLEKEIIEYIQRRFPGNYYKVLKDKVKKIISNKQTNQSLLIDLQDVYLSSNVLPSKTGRLNKDDLNDLPYLLTCLGFCRKENYSVLVRGKLLLVLVPKNELLAFKKYDSSYNPFLLDAKQKILFTFQFLENDGNVIRSLYKKLLSANKFSDRDAGDLLAETYRELAEVSRPYVRNTSGQQQLQRILNIASSIEKWKGKMDTGGKSARTHNVTIRLEPFVDIGLLEKDNPHEYKYTIPNCSKLFFENLYEFKNISDFLHTNFFEYINIAFNFKAKKSKDKNFIIKKYYNACWVLKSPLGYSPIEDAALLTGINSIIKDRYFFEIDEIISILKEYQKKYPDLIRINIDRMGRLAYVKFVGEIKSQ